MSHPTQPIPTPPVPTQPATTQPTTTPSIHTVPALATRLSELDESLSRRDIALDPAGYFVIYLDREHQLICAAHYTNTISDSGVALDPDTGKPLPCNRTLKRRPTRVYQGRSAKEIGIQITEVPNPPLTKLDHALYLGREFVRAERALIDDQDYVQD
ncbi:MAG: DUF4346 domain-containing protein [Elainellaceae cyanobacterium]